MTAYRTRKGWRYDFMVAGRRYTEAWFRTKTLALAAQEVRRSEIKAGRLGGISTFGELVDSYLLASKRVNTEDWAYQQKMKLNKGFAHLAAMPLREIKRGHVEDVLNRMFEAGASATSINEYRKIANSLMNYAVKMEFLDRNPAASISRMPVDDTEVDPIPTANLKKLILASPSIDAALLIVMSQTGARFVEMARLQWTDVMTEAPTPIAFLTTRKRRGGGAKRVPQPLTENAVRVIESLRGLDPQWVFPGKTGGPMRYQSFLNAMQKLCDELEIERCSFHQIRHWTGLIAAGSGKNKKAVSKFLRHQNTAATERYLHALDPEVVQVSERLQSEISDVAGSRCVNSCENTSEGDPKAGVAS